MDCISAAGRRRLRLASVAVATSVAIAGCGSNSPTATQSAKQFVSHALAQQVPFAQCMRAHLGGPAFPRDLSCVLPATPARVTAPVVPVGRSGEQRLAGWARPLP